MLMFARYPSTSGVHPKAKEVNDVLETASPESLASAATKVRVGKTKKVNINVHVDSIFTPSLNFRWDYFVYRTIFLQRRLTQA